MRYSDKWIDAALVEIVLHCGSDTTSSNLMIRLEAFSVFSAHVGVTGRGAGLISLSASAQYAGCGLGLLLMRRVRAAGTRQSLRPPGEMPAHRVRSNV